MSGRLFYQAWEVSTAAGRQLAGARGRCRLETGTRRTNRCAKIRFSPTRPARSAWPCLVLKRSLRRSCGINKKSPEHQENARGSPCGTYPERRKRRKRRQTSRAAASLCPPGFPSKNPERRGCPDRAAPGRGLTMKRLLAWVRRNCKRHFRKMQGQCRRSGTKDCDNLHSLRPPRDSRAKPS